MCAKALYPLGGPIRSQFPTFLFPLRCLVLFHTVSDVHWEAMTLCWHDCDPAASQQYHSSCPTLTRYNFTQSRQNMLKSTINVLRAS